MVATVNAAEVLPAVMVTVPDCDAAKSDWPALDTAEP